MGPTDRSHPITSFLMSTSYVRFYENTFYHTSAVRASFLMSTSHVRFCETHFTTHQRFVVNQSAISPVLGGSGLMTLTWKLAARLYYFLQKSPTVRG